MWLAAVMSPFVYKIIYRHPKSRWCLYGVGSGRQLAWLKGVMVGSPPGHGLNDRLGPIKHFLFGMAWMIESGITHRLRPIQYLLLWMTWMIKNRIVIIEVRVLEIVRKGPNPLQFREALWVQSFAFYCPCSFYNILIFWNAKTVASSSQGMLFFTKKEFLIFPRILSNLLNRMKSMAEEIIAEEQSGWFQKKDEAL